LVEALCYKPEDRGFDSWWGHWIFKLTLSFQRHCGPVADSVSNRKWVPGIFLRVKRGRRVKLTTLPPSVSQMFRENVGASSSHNPMDRGGLLQG
jgi:hypothetical protein